MARQLAAGGTELVLVARSEDRLAALAHDVAVPAEVLIADLADPEQVGEVARRVGDRSRPVDLVVNNAGYGASAPFTSRPADEWHDMVQVNVSAVVELTSAALGRFVPAGGGTVLNVASVAGFVGSAGLGIYSATKSFLITFGLAVHDEARPKGVVVTTLCPGLTSTGFHRRADMEDLGLPGLVWQDPDQVARAGLAGAAAGRALVVPGMVNKVAVTGSRLLPLRAQRRIAGAVRSLR